MISRNNFFTQAWSRKKQI